MKSLLLNSIAKLLFNLSDAGVSTASWVAFYQPESPNEE